MTTLNSVQEAEQILRTQNFSVIYGKGDGNDFYRYLSLAVHKSDTHHKNIREKLYEFQKNDTYYKSFIPRQWKKSRSPEALFQGDLKVSKTDGESPTIRDVYAAAEIFGIDIYIFLESDHHDSKWEWTVLSPMFSQAEPRNIEYLTLLHFTKNGKTQFAEIKSCRHFDSAAQRPEILSLSRFPHRFCQTYRFRNDFRELLLRNKKYPSDSDKMRNLASGTGKNVDNVSLFCCFSEEIYGTVDYFDYLRKLVCSYENHDDYRELFSQFVVPDSTPMVHIDNISKGTHPPGKGEFFALATILRTPIFLCSQHEGNEWTMFSPLTTSMKGKSFISLKKITSGPYERLCVTSGECSCEENQPLIYGQIKTLMNDTSNIIDKLQAKERSCCPSGRHKRHQHLLHAVHKDITALKELEQRNRYILPDPVGYVLDLLKQEGRTLDQIGVGGGTLYDCISKEIYGTEVHCELVQRQLNAHDEGQLDDETDISNFEMIFKRTASFLAVPIYIFYTKKQRYGYKQNNPQYSWMSVIPEIDHRSIKGHNLECRFYVTLFHNVQNGKFDRIVPNEGCNCQRKPPILVLYKTTALNYFSGNDGVLVELQDRHEPLVEFLLDDIKEEDFDHECRNIIMPHPYTESYQVLQRPDMAHRCIDKVTLDSNSFYRCMSKEIFGTERNFSFLREKMCVEMEACKDIIGQILCDREKDTGFWGYFGLSNSKTSAYENRLTMIKNDCEADDVEILTTATLFQITIFILQLEETGSSRWIEFSHIKRKRKPLRMPRRQSRCRQTGRDDRYYVTLIRYPTGHYDRIVSREEICNCLMTDIRSLDLPIVPTTFAGLLTGFLPSEQRHFEIAMKLDRCFARVKRALNDWFLASELMESLCITIIEKLETQRKKVHKATILGTGTSIIGSIMAIAGLAAGPVTFGGSLGLTVAGGAVTAGSKINEHFSNKNDLNIFELCRKRFDSKNEVLKKEIADLSREIHNLGKEINDLLKDKNLRSLELNTVQSLASLVRTAKEFSTIATSIFKMPLRASTILKGILSPIALIVDIALFTQAIRNLMQEESTTKVSKNLRLTLSILKASRIQMQVWAYGNEQDSSVLL